MADGFEKDDPFSQLEGKDGFHVVSVEFADTLTLSCVAYGGGEMVNLLSDDPEDSSIALVEIENPTPTQQGAVERLRLVLDAVARYLTTGGSWKDLQLSQDKMRKVAAGGLRFPGYHLCTSYSTTDGTYQHIFVKNDGSGDAALWEEPTYNEHGGVIGGWIEPTTLQRIREEQENDEAIWGAATQRYVEGGIVTKEEFVGGDDTDLLCLQLSAGSEPATKVEGGDQSRVPEQSTSEGVVHEATGACSGDSAGGSSPTNS
jgi:hypothetical protein